MRRAAIGMLLVAAAVGCQLIVSSDVPDYACASSSPSACPSGMVCDTAAGKCVQSATIEAGDDVDVPDDAGDAQVDGDAGGPLAIGENCGFDSDCDSKLCASSTILTTAIITSGASSVCTKTCCTSADCAIGFVCFSPGTGGNYCVDSTRASRAMPGAKTPGQACSANGDCRSGSCVNSRCMDTCCQPADCSAGTTCRVSNVGGHDSWVCGTPNDGGANVAATCVNQSDCKNDNCLGPLGPARTCRPTCCSAASCSAQSFPSSHCRYVPSGLDQLKSCEPNIDGGNRAAVGAICSADTDCQSEFCDPELKKCALPCCEDKDCATGEECRPSRTSKPFLRCVKAGR